LRRIYNDLNILPLYSLELVNDNILYTKI
jgi:hypothetical protein